MVVHQVVLAKQVPAPTATVATYDYSDPLLAPTTPPLVNRVIQPPEWAPFSLLAAGAIVMLYALAMKAGG